jgi:hypothetical protein
VIVALTIASETPRRIGFKLTQARDALVVGIGETTTAETTTAPASQPLHRPHRMSSRSAHTSPASDVQDVRDPEIMVRAAADVQSQTCRGVDEAVATFSPPSSTPLSWYRWLESMCRKSPGELHADKTAPVYGEVTRGSLAKLAEALRLNDKDIIVEAGSGRGLPSYFWALESSSTVIGVEIVPTRWAIAETWRRNWEKCNVDAAERVAFVCGDASTMCTPDDYICNTSFEGYPSGTAAQQQWGEVTVWYEFDTGFPTEVLTETQRKILMLFESGALRCCVSYEKDWADDGPLAGRVRLAGKVSVHMAGSQSQFTACIYEYIDAAKAAGKARNRARHKRPINPAQGNVRRRTRSKRVQQSQRENWLSRFCVRAHGVLDELPIRQDIVVVDPAGLAYIKNGPRGAGYASGAIYAWLSTQSTQFAFPHILSLILTGTCQSLCRAAPSSSCGLSGSPAFSCAWQRQQHLSTAPCQPASPAQQQQLRSR